MIMRTLLIALLFSTQLWADDNIISIEQTGDNLLLEFDQEGNGNKIDTVFGGVYLDTAMSQQGVRNQVLKRIRKMKNVFTKCTNVKLLRMN